MSAAPAPTVSVCIPAYNAARFIGEAIGSVLAQTCRDFELVVVDDASADDTVDVVRRFSDPRLRLLRNARNLGLAGNWNRATSEARGRYVKLLCQDDLLRPDCLADQVAVLDHPGNGDVALVCARRDITPPGIA